MARSLDYGDAPGPRSTHDLNRHLQPQAINHHTQRKDQPVKTETKIRETFANSPRGRIRRDSRRAAIAAKRAWLEM